MEKNERIATMQHRSVYGAAIAFLIGSIVVVGWVADIGIFKSVLPGGSTMKLNTALCFVLSGAMLHATRKNLPRWALALALPVFAVGVLTLAEYSFGVDFGIDNSLIVDTSSPFPGRMAPMTAFLFTSFSASTAAYAMKRHATSLGLATIVWIAGYLAVVGYLLNARGAYTIGFYSSMAIHTAVLFAALGLSMMSQNAGHGLTKIVVSEHAGGTLARAFIPTNVLTHIVIAVLTYRGHLVGWYGWEFGLTMMTVLSTMLNGAFFLTIAQRLNTTEEQRVLDVSLLQEKITGANASLRTMTEKIQAPVGDPLKQDLRAELERQSQYIVLLEGQLNRKKS